MEFEGEEFDRFVAQKIRQDKDGEIIGHLSVSAFESLENNLKDSSNIFQALEKIIVDYKKRRLQDFFEDQKIEELGYESSLFQIGKLNGKDVLTEDYYHEYRLFLYSFRPPAHAKTFLRQWRELHPILALF